MLIVALLEHNFFVQACQICLGNFKGGMSARRGIKHCRSLRVTKRILFISFLIIRINCMHTFLYLLQSCCFDVCCMD